MSVQTQIDFTAQVKNWVAEAKNVEQNLDGNDESLDAIADALLSVIQLISSALSEHDEKSSVSCHYLYGVVYAVQRLHNETALPSNALVSELYRKLQGLNPAGI